MKETTAQDITNEVLNEIEREKIMAFCEDEVLFEAVKKYILTVACKHGTFQEGQPFKTNRNYALQLAWGAADGTGIPRTNEELGQDLRALTKAVQLVGSGFNEMQEMKKPEEVEVEKVNEAE